MRGNDPAIDLALDGDIGVASFWHSPFSEEYSTYSGMVSHGFGRSVYLNFTTPIITPDHRELLRIEIRTRQGWPAYGLKSFALYNHVV